MNFKNDFDVFVGGKSGFFKGIKIGQKECVQKNLKSFISIGYNDEITTASWGDDEEREILIAYGTKETRSVSIYDTEDMSFTNTFVCDIGQGSINGISRYDGAILTAVHSGEIKLWKFNDQDQVILNAGSNLYRMCHSNVNKKIIATGGKENGLKLFDLEKQKQIFSEKNMPHDFLNLRVPIWISDIAFLQDSHKIVTVSRFGYVRLYDTNVQRRPMINIEIKDEPLTAVTVPCKEMQVMVGSGKGMMKLIDLRKPGKILHTYKGLVGSITGLASSKMGPYVVSTSLDRHLRVHNINTKEMIKKVYLTSKLTCLILRSTFSIETQIDNSEKVPDNNSISNSNNNDNEVMYIDNKLKDTNDDAEYEELFDKMEVITSKHKKTNLCYKRKKCTKSASLVDHSEESKTSMMLEPSNIIVKSKKIKKRKKLISNN
ncbi:WD repeat-containing protein 74 [Vespa crabro]|uniref:WD repeat-containing protein 74 n=1 Tax=Vespa crabro TaxID=7445 RepID=UPI001EFF8432|nr:WD repeat-containing protein 74 [Vespa crabro]